MKNFLLRLSVFLLLQATLLFAQVIIYFHSSVRGVEYESATVDKHNLLSHQPSPRIIFVGGSNVGWGLDSNAFLERFGLNPVNMGLDVDLGLDFMLNEVKESARTGDVIVISPEYEHFEESYLGGNYQHLFKVLYERPASARYLAASNFSNLLDQGLILTGDLTRFSLQIFTGGNKPTASSDSPRRESFNNLGDEISHYYRPRRVPTYPLELNPSNSSIERVIRRLNLFNSFCRNRAVAVYFSFPSLSDDGYERNREAIQRVESLLRARLTIPLINTPHQMVFPRAHLSDGYYHLDRTGTYTRTQRVLEELWAEGIRPRAG